MKPPTQSIRLNKREADILNSIKRRTKINQWNILCRMALCLSCQDPSEPLTSIDSGTEGAVEIDWETFSGNSSEIYIAIFKIHKKRTNSVIPDSEYFKKLLSRGIHKLKDVK
jgi:DNA sulfur modification protein DndE